jgi:cell division protein FtsI/penicillin-binding protein 2
VRSLPDSRLRLAMILAVIGFGIVIGRAVQIQGVRADSLVDGARKQQRVTITIPVTRGSITDRNGHPLAQQVVAKTVMVHPVEVKDPELTATYIAQKLGYTKRKQIKAEAEKILPALTAKVAQAIVPDCRQLTPEAAATIMEGNPPGLFLVDEPRRGYPFGPLASQLLGYTDIDLKGRPSGAGLEYTLDPVLTGHPGKLLEIQAPDGSPLERVTMARPHPGRSVELTIDQAIQSKVQSVLAATVRQFRARSATAIVLQPKTGEILAMATAPSYNNNDVHSLKNFLEATRNRAVQDTYEPGSTFKVVTMAAALDAGVVYPQMKFNNLPYQIQVSDRVVHDDNPRGPITLTAAQILQQSSNVGTVTIAQMVGKDLLSQWIDRFGFGRDTALHAYGEQPGLVLPPDKWYGSSIGNIPIGQGISVTPIQMAAMYSAIANGGVLVEPHLVRHVQGDAPVKPTTRRIVRASVDHELVDMLKGVVDTAAGTGVRAAIPGYTVAGKTGTAQKADGHGGYSHTNYVASFVGFFPADDPQAEVMVVVDSPRGTIFGGLVAAPAFQEIGTFLTQALSIKPDRPITP